MKDLINFIKKFFSLLFKGNFKALFIEPTDDGFMQFFRYIFVGGASFVTDYALLHLITEIGVYYLISGVISFLAGLWVNYELSKLLVFQKKTSGAEKAKEMNYTRNYFASSLRQKGSKTVAIIVNDIDIPAYGEMVAIISASTPTPEIRRQGHSIRSWDTRKSPSYHAGSTVSQM